MILPLCILKSTYIVSFDLRQCKINFMDMINLYNSNFQVIFDSTIYQNGAGQEICLCTFFHLILNYYVC